MPEKTHSFFPRNREKDWYMTYMTYVTYLTNLTNLTFSPQLHIINQPHVSQECRDQCDDGG